MESNEQVRLPSVAHAMDTGVSLHDPDTAAILDANERIERLYGYSRADLRKMAIEDVTAPSAKFTQAEAIERTRAAADGDEQSFDWQIVRENGEVRWIDVTLNATTVDGHECVIAEVRDITDSRAREQRLRLLSRIVRHNLRNRSSVLIGYAERIKQSVEEDSLEAQAETLMDVSMEIGSLSESVTELEEVLELDAADRSARNLGDFVRDFVDGFGERYPQLSVRCDGGDDVWVIADRGLEYALEHALQNVVEHGPAAPTVEITVEEGPNVGSVRIVDEGPPIPEEEIAVLSQDVAASSTYHGTGVGLWVMQWAVRSLGGELSFDQTTDGGNVVTITLPKSRAQ